jgi:putative colanic acid biosynthesis acetyltransferase WcaF
VALLLWEFTWAVLCRWTPKPCNFWRVFWLRLFGCTIIGRPFVHQRARIHIPWHLTLRDRACLGDGAWAYSLGRIDIGEEATIAQEAFLCTGTHDFSQPSMNLITAPIVVGPKCFVAARASVMPGVNIGEGAIVGACAVVVKDVEPWTVVAGNPAKAIGKRELRTGERQKDRAPESQREQQNSGSTTGQDPQ